MTTEAKRTGRGGATERFQRVAGARVRVEVVEEEGVHRLVFAGEDEKRVRVDAEGDLHVEAPLGPDEVAVFDFELQATAKGDRFDGIQLARSDGDWESCPTTMDTGGAYYRGDDGDDLPFTVAPSTEQRPQLAFVLTQYGALDPRPETFAYRLHVRYGGRVHTHDPKIYNEGGPGGGRRGG